MNPHSESGSSKIALLLIGAFILVILVGARAVEAVETVETVVVPVSRSVMEGWREPFEMPGLLTSIDLERFQNDLERAKLRSDRSCGYTQRTIMRTIVEATEVDRTVCEGRDREVVLLARTRGLYVCENGQVKMAMRTSIGASGFGKEFEGDNRTPVGRYWLGLPRKSARYGLFIPVGYPNQTDLELARTGSAIGIHSVRRYLWYDGCGAERHLQSDWTQGCIAVARDQQIIELAKWVVANWPVLLEVVPVPQQPRGELAQPNAR